MEEKGGLLYSLAKVATTSPPRLPPKRKEATAKISNWALNPRDFLAVEMIDTVK